MHQSRYALVGLVLCACGAAAPVGSAAIVEVKFQGTVAFAAQGFAEFPPELTGVVEGDVFEFTTVFDTAATADDAIFDSTFGVYPLLAMAHTSTLRIASSTETAASDATFEVYDNIGGFDALNFQTTRTNPNFFTDDSLQIFTGFDMTILSNDKIPETPLTIPLADPNNNSFLYHSFLNLSGRQEARIGGPLTQITVRVVPAPGAAAVMAVAGVALGRRRRR